MGVRSMTGFGNAQRGGLAAEVRSVNHRNLDVRLQLPDGWGGLVADLTQQLKAQAHRGSVTLRITQDVEAVEEVALADVDRRVQRWHRVAAHMGRNEEPPLSWVLSGLGRTAASAPVIDELTALVHESLSEWNAQRAREGAVLERQLRALLAQMRLHLEAIELAEPRALQAAQDRLERRMADRLGAQNVDPVRVLHEVAVLAERRDLAEERVRLAGHLDAMEDALDQGGAVGRSLGFLAQELLREVNTIGSKASDAALTEQVVALKVLIEQLREQVLNLE